MLEIEGGHKLEGKIRISGSKNAGLAVLAGSLLCDKLITFVGLPDINDIFSMNQLLVDLGSKISFDATKIKKYDVNHPVMTIDNSNITKYVAEYDFVKKMRASIFVLGPLLSRFGRAKVSMPGGCAIGVRAVDLHIKGLEAMGAKIEINNGYIDAEAKNGLTGCEFEFPKDRVPSVGATENLLTASVLAKGRTILKHVAKEPEIVALAEFLISMGAKIKGHGTDIIEVDGVTIDELHSTEYQVPADRIEAGTFAIATAITDGHVYLKNCDMSLFDCVKKEFNTIGIGLKEVEDDSKKCIYVYKSHDFQPCDISTAVYPGFPTDLQAQIMIPLLLANGTSQVKENIFENRFMHVAELNRMGANITIQGNTATIKGNTTLKSANLMATDLRASASLVLASLIVEGTSSIDRIYHLDRGYENLELKLNNCGAKIRRIAKTIM